MSDDASTRAVPPVPFSHTLNADQLRRLHQCIDTLAFRSYKDHEDVPRPVFSAIESVITYWQPILDSVKRQHLQYQAQRRAREPGSEDADLNLSIHVGHGDADAAVEYAHDVIERALKGLDGDDGDIVLKMLRWRTNGEPA